MMNDDLMFVDQRKKHLDEGFAAAFARAPERYFSAPGRSEIGGNHTDHQGGRVLAAAVDLDMVAAVAANDRNCIRVLSQGYPMCCVDLHDLDMHPDEQNSSAALIRGMASYFHQKTLPIGGFDAYILSNVLPGSGLSSSAAFEVLLGAVMNGLFFADQLSSVEIAQAGQFSENVYFGKPCGLMDQIACALGGFAAIDFSNAKSPHITPIPFDFDNCGYALCIIDTKADHADLTDEYAAVTKEMKLVSRFFGKELLTEVDEETFYSSLPLLRQHCGDRAVLRALHEFEENKRVDAQTAALLQGDFHRFLWLVKESGRSSWMYLQNVIPSGSVQQQDMALTLALCDKYLGGEGAYRVHGGGFAGTVQAFVPREQLASFKNHIDRVLGENACRVLSVRSSGAGEWGKVL